jgi:GNAT superfamily N-acetyltransferase
MLTIRRAQPADLEQLVPMFDAYRAFFAGGTPSGSREFLSERLREGDAVFLVAFAQERAVGFLTLYPLFSSWYATRIWFLSDLYVRDDVRNGGIGRRLVEEAKGFARDNRSRSIMVEIPHREPHLVKFYEDLSFVLDRDFNLHRYYLD